jgi:hypothetical protein
MAKIEVFEIGDKVRFNKIEDYRDIINGNKIDLGINTIRYENQETVLSGTILDIDVFNHTYLIHIDKLKNMQGNIAQMFSITLKVKFEEVKTLSN